MRKDTFTLLAFKHLKPAVYNGREKLIFSRQDSDSGSFFGNVEEWDKRNEEQPAAQLHMETDEPFLHI